MKFTIVLSTVLFALAAAKPDPDPRLPPYRIDPSEEEILKDLQDFQHKTFSGLKIVSSEVGHGLIRTAAHILTDNLRLHVNKQVLPIFKNGISTEGIISNIGDLIVNRSRHDIIFKYPSHEGIIQQIGPFYDLLNAQRMTLKFQYNNLVHSVGPSHEAVGGNLGQLVLNKFSNFSGIHIPGDVLGSLYYAPSSSEGVNTENGILLRAGELLVKGAAKSAKSLVRSLFSPLDYLYNQSSLLLARGQFNGYPNLQILGQLSVLDLAQNVIKREKFTQDHVCIKVTEQNLEKLFNEFIEISRECHNTAYPQGQLIIKLVFDILLDAFHRVEHLQHEAANCLKKIIPENRRKCLDREIPSLVATVREKVREYRGNLQGFVHQFSNLNTEFDICLTKQLGIARRAVYGINDRFRSCVEEQEADNPPSADAASKRWISKHNILI